MKKLLARLTELRIPDWSIPLALMGICILAYGILIPKIGFYQDDWHFNYYAYTRGAAGLTELLNYDGHPLAALLYILSFKLLGFNPLYWQIFALFWRWLAVSAFWLVLHLIWPSHRRVTFTAAVIYIIYPLYTMQSMAIVYFEVWISHFLLAVSFLLTIEAIKRPKRFWLFLILAILVKLLHTLSSEYTWGMELARPFLIFCALPILQGENSRSRISRAIKIFLPFFVIAVASFVWRGLIYQSPLQAANAPQLFDTILADPVGGITLLVSNFIPDMVLILFSTWFQTLAPGMFVFTDKFNLQIFGLIILSTAALVFFLSKMDAPDGENAPETNQWMQGAFLFGAAALVFGLIPSYAAGYFVHLKLEPWNGRFAMGSMPGVALLGAIFIEYVISAPRKRLFAIALILSLGIGWQIRMTNVFRWAWDAETNFYHQLLLRAPQIAPHTAFLAESEFLGRMGDYPTSFALNSIYATPGDVNSKEVRTWLFLINSNFSGHIDGLLSTIPLEATKSSSHFIGKSSDSLVIYFEPDLGQCLWIITPENSDMPIVPKILRTVSPLTNLSLIQQSDSPPPFYQLLAAPQPDDWCSFYQRGSLAHQFGEWDKAAAQWQQAADKGLRPANGFEYLPFIDSYARLGKWAQALELTKNSNKASKGMANTLCSTWRRLEQQTTTSPGREATLNQALDILQCN